MNTKMMLLLGVGAIGVYLLFMRPAKPRAGTSNTVASNNYVATGIAAGTKILGAILQTGGGSTKSSATGASRCVRWSSSTAKRRVG